MAIELRDIYQLASELDGDGLVSVKAALWAGVLSANAGIRETCEQMGRLRPYYARELPQDSDQVRELLRGTGLTRVKLDGLYHVQGLANCGALVGLESIGATYEQQKVWRDTVLRLCTTHGLAYKTISFAALIISPFTCELIPVDRHVLARQGNLPLKWARNKRRYQALEVWIHHERDCDAPNVSGAIYHWLRWAQHIADKYPDRAAAESHAALSCRA